ncbi:hypothetical protein HPPN120_03420 [Helicobacter pylori Puno120]|nr:hypothetical protein HPPN120_03420 [Helicobacter pylori Puno120]
MLELGDSPKLVEQEQKILVLVLSWTWTSSPITASNGIICPSSCCSQWQKSSR